jgi:YbbR domain-containing protein
MKPIWPFRHIGLKLLSVALAVVLWMAVSGERTVERMLRVPLELQQFPPGLELQGEIPSTVEVRVRGASGSLARLGPADVIAEIDMRGARPGKRLFPLPLAQVRAPFDVQVLQVTPSSIAMLLEPSATRAVPIAPTVDGKPAPGFVVGKVVCDPRTVDVVGPESSVERVAEALTEAVSVAGARSDVHQNVALGLSDPALRFKSRRAAAVTVNIQPAPMERSLRGVPVHFRNVGAGLLAQAAPAVTNVTVRGNREAMGGLAADDVTVYVDCGGLGLGSYSLTLHADASDDIGVVHFDPQTVQVQISGRD